MANVNLRGLGVALITPFKKDLTVDYDSLAKIIQHVLEGGCDYLVALGTTAETPTLSREEKNEITKFIRERVAGRVPLVIGIGGNSTRGVTEDIKSRDLEGYSAILSVAPYYNKPTQEGLYEHFKAISESAPIPVLLYNVPGRTGVNMTARTTLRLAEECPNICGIKEASADLAQCEEIMFRKPAHFQLISGNDSDITSIMKMGGAGVISVLANALPKETKKLVELCGTFKFDEATKFQESLKKLILPLFEDGNPAGVKALLSHRGLCENILRLPLVPVSRRVEEKLIKESAPYLS